MLRKRSILGYSTIIFGLLLVIFSIFSFIKPHLAMQVIATVFSCLIIISGLIDVLYFNKANEYSEYGSWLFLISGVLSVISGFTFLFNVDLTEMILTIMFPVWFIFRCTVQLMSLNFIHIAIGITLYIMSIIFNVSGILLAILMMSNPFTAEYALVYTIAIYSILIGTMSISIGFSKLGQK